ncbi:polyprenyl synthetase family protein [Ectothiorhodospiraceae bacterium WFHF3C12]|nr:polyprenyl synthetase family protein [Ectothiorhodospiraceae bacterium WFHF3C12]
MSRNDLAAHRLRYTERVEKALDTVLPEAGTHPAQLHEAMRYAVFNGGKRIRPTLAYATGEALGVELEHVDYAAAAVELIHCYSLVHDDLPAMDDDDIRRGKPTCHRAFDEATAILVGDALQALAFRTIASHMPAAVPADARLEMVALLSLAAGSRGMAGGQMIDLQAVGRPMDVAQLEDMHIHKTGALIRASVLLAALCDPGLTSQTRGRLDHFAKCLGLAFQIQDDVLDVDGDQAVTGKASGADARLNKPTYPALLGVSEARRFARQLVEDALESIAPLGKSGHWLKAVADYVIARDH